MNYSCEQMQEACAAWAIATDGKMPLEIEALFWKALCERLLDGRIANNSPAQPNLSALLCSDRSTVGLLADPALRTEWTRDWII